MIERMQMEIKNYKALPVVHKVIQWDGSVESAKEILKFAEDNDIMARVAEVGAKFNIRIYTDPQTSFADCRPFDWIIIGPEKNVSVMPNHIFLINYEEAK